MTGSQARISALALVVPDYDLAIAFYVGKLGFTLTEDIDQGHKRWVTVEPPGGGARLVLARAEGQTNQALCLFSTYKLYEQAISNQCVLAQRRQD